MVAYTNLGITQIDTGAEAGTWGATTNTNFAFFDTAICGVGDIVATIPGTTAAPNPLPITDATTSDGRNRVLKFTSASDLGATVFYQITPNDFRGYYLVQNNLAGSRALTIFQGTYNAGRALTIPANQDLVITCNGLGAALSTVISVLSDVTFNSLNVAAAPTVGTSVMNQTAVNAAIAAAEASPSPGIFTTITASSTLNVSGTSGLATVNATALNVSGTSGLAAVTATTISTTGNVTLGNAAADSVQVNGFAGFGIAPQSNVATYIKGTTTGSGAFAIATRNSSNIDMFQVRNDGLINTGIDATLTFAPYNNTTASAANMFVSNSGALFRSTSSRRYKNDIQDATHGLADILKLRSVTYRGNNDGETTFSGFVAEEVDEAGLTEFVVYNAAGQPDALHYGNMVALLAKGIQELTARVAELEAALAARPA